MTIARQFYLLICVPPLTAIAFAIALTYQFASLSAQGSRLLGTLHRTGVISQRLTLGNADQEELLDAQLEKIDPTFPDRLRRIDYELGEQCTEYLRLDIGPDERLTVERIKALQSEMSIVAMSIYRDLEAGGDRRATAGFSRASRIEGQMRDEFGKLNALQLNTLQVVLQHLNRTASQGLFAVGALIVALLAAAAATVALVRRRLLQPVRNLLHASERMRLGDLTARAPAGHADELGQLTRGFNFMAESLAASHAGLEHKVEERTRQLREVQDQLLQAEKLSAVGLLVGGVAHELNNPLATIMGYNELAHMELAAAPGGIGASRLLDQVDAQVERCRRIVGNLLQFARKQQPRMEVFEVNAAVDQMVELRGYDLATRNIHLVREFDAASPLLCADRDKIQQVVLNLLNNAADAIGDTGRAGTIIVRTRAEGGNVVLELLDDGTGFREPERIFDPFYTTKEVGKGTGLGLSVCYGIVREHNGDIEAGNWEKGARVRVTLPAGDPEGFPQAETTVAAPARGASTTSAAPRALVVDDEEALLRLQAAFLAKMGIEAHTVTSGDDAIRFLRQGDRCVDLIISDVRMPGIDGVQLYEWVRVNLPQLAGRFLFVSGDVMGLNLGDSLAATGVARIDKPFRYGAYAVAVRGVLESGGVPL